MIDDVFSGILSGLFGPVISQWALKFRYRLIFAVVVISIYVFAYLSIVIGNGWSNSFDIFIDRTFTLTGVLVPIGIGLIAVACVFVSSVGMRHKDR